MHSSRTWSASTVTLRVLLVDDEPVARRRLARLLRDDRDVEIAGQCGDGASAVTAVRTLEPDLVLLDVQMPEMDGFDVLQALGP
jgi:two-component system, LytTR family, response regulator